MRFAVGRRVGETVGKLLLGECEGADGVVVGWRVGWGEGCLDGVVVGRTVG